MVYLALDRQLHSRHVVVKFLHAVWDGHERIRNKFNQEIEALSRLHHPAVVGVLDVGQAPDGRSFLVMEYVEGTNLRSLLPNRPLEFSQAARILTEADTGAGLCGGAEGLEDRSNHEAGPRNGRGGYRSEAS